ncbi:DUF4097 family beta strand repeat-containing protein [Alteromonas sp. 1_MG-2023]|uniref:DUF4097 family beta strand repeat-containing protein n=1 Tax=Alteromonas sp. 1_MG-2023 TaxID=3062669 RepID=UPI0026E3DB43|nr:DUF4097 family beta strand repeat-containing protein [Alteromonas sp. 1_MG-2023]MDO6568532.1 DUF4097 family beta strand repeat-containing protein [Alteromonas sp. 1_MG-2023]
MTTIRKTLASVLFHGVLISSSLLAVSAHAGEKIDRMLDAPNNAKIDIEHVNGDAEIRGWDKPQVQVTGELGENTEEFIFEQRGNVIVIHVEVERSGMDWWKNKSKVKGDDLVIFVPKTSDVNYTAVNADVEISDITQGVNVEVVNGDVLISDVADRVKVESVNGDITLKNVKGRLDIETVNGDVEAAHSGQEDVSFVAVNGDLKLASTSPDVTVETVNGGIDLKLEKIDSLSVTTVNGTTNARMYLNKNGRLNANSVGGELHFSFQPEVAAQFDIETHAGGKITNNVSSDEAKKPKYGPSSWLRFINNDGSANVDISTVNGRITIDAQ